MATEELDGVALSSLDAPLGDGLGVTKGDLVTYLAAVADRMVPGWPADRSRSCACGPGRRRSCSAM